MWDKKQVSKPVGRRHSRMSPPPLPPRWGEGVAPPSSPQISHPATPATSPGYGNYQWNYQQGYGETTRRRQGGRSSQGHIYENQDSSSRESVSNRRKKIQNNQKFASKKQIDQSVTGVFNQPSQHTQYHIKQIPLDSILKIKEIERQSCKNTQHRKELQKPLPVSALPLSYPSPPILNKHRNIPLTSTLIASPPKPFNAQYYSIHPTSPATPEMSAIPQRVTDATTYQNYEAGVAYIPARLYNTDQRNSTLQPQTVDNLSRFNVSPPQKSIQFKSEGTKQYNNKVEIQWIYDQQTKTKNMFLEPRKVN